MARATTSNSHAPTRQDEDWRAVDPVLRALYLGGQARARRRPLKEAHGPQDGDAQMLTPCHP